MIPGQGPVLQAVLGTLLTWGLTAAGSALVFIFSSGQVSTGQGLHSAHRQLWQLEPEQKGLYFGPEWSLGWQGKNPACSSPACQHNKGGNEILNPGLWCLGQSNGLFPLCCVMLRTSRALIFKLFHIPKLETPPPAVVFRIAVLDLLFMSLSCDDLFRSALQSEIPFAAARCFSSWGRAMC